jgi:hypothetical protein
VCFDKLLKYHKNILLGDLNVKLGKEYICNQTIENDNLHEISNDNGVRVVNFATYKNLSQMYDSPTSQHHNTNRASIGKVLPLMLVSVVLAL